MTYVPPYPETAPRDARPYDPLDDRPPRDPARARTGGWVVDGGRPAGILAVAGVFAFGALFLLLGAFALLGTGYDFGALPDIGRPDRDTVPDAPGLGLSLLFGFLVLTFAAVAMAVAWGLYRGDRWAWAAALGLTMLAAVAAFVALVGGNAVVGILTMLVAGVVAWYLLRADVAGWFGVRAGAHRAPRRAV